MFTLHPQLEKDCFQIGDLPLCRVLLMNDSRYPWVILVPRREAISEIYQLSQQEQQQCLAESSYIGQAMMQHFNGDKLNVAALGNVVSQLHLHHVIRYQGDSTWPAPVWGKGEASAYDERSANLRIEALRDMINTYSLARG